jgi:hypothetical protein
LLHQLSQVKQPKNQPSHAHLHSYCVVEAFAMIQRHNIALHWVQLFNVLLLAEISVTIQAQSCASMEQYVLLVNNCVLLNMTAILDINIIHHRISATIPHIKHVTTTHSVVIHLDHVTNSVFNTVKYVPIMSQFVTQQTIIILINRIKSNYAMVCAMILQLKNAPMVLSSV